MRRIGISYTEKSLVARRNITRGFASLDETVYIFSGAALDIENRDRCKFEGTTCSNRTPVPVPPYEDVWQLTFKTKKDICLQATE